MNVIPSGLMGSACALSVVTLLFTGNLLAMTATASAAILLAALAIPTLNQQQEDKYTPPLDG